MNRPLMIAALTLTLAGCSYPVNKPPTPVVKQTGTSVSVESLQRALTQPPDSKVCHPKTLAQLMLACQ